MHAIADPTRATRGVCSASMVITLCAMVGAVSGMLIVAGYRVIQRWCNLNHDGVLDSVTAMNERLNAFTVRLDDDLYAWLRKYAHRHRWSLNQAANAVFSEARDIEQAQFKEENS